MLVSQHNPAMQDIEQGLTNSLSRDGKGGMLADLSAGGHRVTQMQDGAADTDGATVGQIKNLANNTRRSLAELKASAITDLSSIYDGSLWNWTAGDFSGRVNDRTIVQSDNAPITQGAWVRSFEMLSTKMFGGKGDGTSDDAAAVLATSAAAAGKTFRIDGIARIASAITITSPITDGLTQIFTLASAVTIDTGQPVRPEWWGIGAHGCVDAAIRSLPQPKGGVVLLGNATYPSSDYRYNTGSGGKYMDRVNVKLRGAKMPAPQNDCRALQGGTILQGMFLPFADGFEASDLGIDSGATVIAANPGEPGEGLVMTFASEALKAANTLRRGARLHNVIALAPSPSSPTHALILGEGYTDVVCTGDVIGIYGVHGAAIKCTNLRAEAITTYMNNSEGCVIKTDAQTTAAAINVVIGRLSTIAGAPSGTSPYATAVGAQAYGLQLFAANGSVDSIQIGIFRSTGATKGIGTLFAGDYVISSVQIGEVYLDQGGAGGTKVGIALSDNGSSGGRVQRFHINKAEVRNTTVGFQPIFNVRSGNQERASIDHLTVTNGQTAIDIGNTAYVDVGVVVAEGLSGGAYHITGTPYLAVSGKLLKDGNTATVYNTASGGLAPALAAGWTNVGGDNDSFAVELVGGLRALSGTVVPGSGATNLVAQIPQFAWPTGNKRFLAQGAAGGALTNVPVILTSDGKLYVNEVGGGVANCSQFLSLSGIVW